jgi:hypothetical protein
MADELPGRDGHILRYVTVRTAGDGGSRFDELTVRLAQTAVATGMPQMLVGVLSAATELVYLRSDEFDSQPHPAPRRQWVVMLRGGIEVETSDGERRQFSPGDLLLAADTTGRGHITRAVGIGPHEALFVPVPEA